MTNSSASLGIFGVFATLLFHAIGCGPRAHGDPVQDSAAVPDGAHFDSSGVAANDSAPNDRPQEQLTLFDAATDHTDSNDASEDQIVGAPSIVSVTPAAGALDADPAGTVVVQFSQPMESASVTAANLILSDGNSNVPVSVSLSGATATLTPAKQLWLLTTYQLTVKGSVRSAQGQAIGTDFTSTFSVRDGAWAAPAIAPFTADTVPIVTADASGNFLAVWIQAIPGGAAYHVMASWRSIAGVWSTAMQLDVGSGVPLSTVIRASSNDSGDAVVMWNDMARQYRSGAWNASPERYDASGVLTYPLALSMSPQGDAMLVGTGGTSVVASHLAAAGQWDATPALVGAWSAMSVSLALAPDPAGDWFLGWVSTAFSTILAPMEVTRFVASTGRWSIATNAPGTDTVAGYPSIAADTGGEALVVWPATGTDLKTARFTKANGWIAAAPVVQPLNSDRMIARTQLIFDGQNYLLTWHQTLSGVNNLYANRLTTQGWGASTLVSDGDHSLNFPLSLRTDQRGNSVVLWQQIGMGGSDIAVGRYTEGKSTWSPPHVLNAVPIPATGAGDIPDVAVSRNGSALAVWGTRDSNGRFVSVGEALFQ